MSPAGAPDEAARQVDETGEIANHSVPGHPWLPLVLVLCAYLPLVLWYSLVVPVFEAPDESAHYGVAQSLSTTGRLPVLNYESPGFEEHQPPLYYAFVAAVFRLTAAGDTPNPLAVNPHAAVSAVNSFGNKNTFLHGDVAEQWPFRGLPLAVHLARLVSVAFGVLTVVATYGIARGVFGRARRWLAATPGAVVAFTPQFVFISGAINNDIAVAALSALVLWLVVVYGEKPRSMAWLVALGVAGGLASLTKAGGLAAVAFVVIGLIVKALRTRQLNHLWRDVFVAVAASALTGGWWYARNLVLYDDPLLWRYITRWYGGARPSDFGQLLRRFWEGLPSYWGVFGWLNIAWPDWVYRLLSVLTVAAGLGLVIFLVKYVRGKREAVNPSRSSWFFFGPSCRWQPSADGSWSPAGYKDASCSPRSALCLCFNPRLDQLVSQPVETACRSGVGGRSPDPGTRNASRVPGARICAAKAPGRGTGAS